MYLWLIPFGSITVEEVKIDTQRKENTVRLDQVTEPEHEKQPEPVPENQPEPESEKPEPEPELEPKKREPPTRKLLGRQGSLPPIPGVRA
jgi:hypothetical protein